jgi:hypothetical protein
MPREGLYYCKDCGEEIYQGGVYCLACWARRDREREAEEALLERLMEK